MSPGARMECIESIYLRYKRASRKEKSLILNEFCATCGYHRKHAIRLLRTFKRFTKPKPKTPYERVLESKHVDPSVKRSLKEQFETLNPFQLKKGIETKMKKIFDYLKPMNYPQYYTYSQREKVGQKEKVTTTKSQQSFGNI